MFLSLVIGGLYVVAFFSLFFREKAKFFMIILKLHCSLVISLIPFYAFLTCFSFFYSRYELSLILLDNADKIEKIKVPNILSEKETMSHYANTLLINSRVIMAGGILQGLILISLITTPFMYLYLIKLEETYKVCIIILLLDFLL
jgi:hypothetical protein